MGAADPGGPDDFHRLVEGMAAGDPSEGSSPAVRALFAIRWKLGELLGWDRRRTASARACRRFATACPPTCATARPGPDFDALPFDPLYLLDDEWAGEIANRTMHGVCISAGSPTGAAATAARWPCS